jgi:hypothetical protein
VELLAAAGRSATYRVNIPQFFNNFIKMINVLGNVCRLDENTWMLDKRECAVLMHEIKSAF